MLNRTPYLETHPCGVQLQEARLLARLFETEASRLAGRADALRSLVRFVDTRAAELLHTVDDVLLEAAQRRASEEAVTSAGGDAAAGERGTGSQLQSGAPVNAQRPAASGGGAAATQGRGAEAALGAGLWWPGNAVPGGGAGRGRGQPEAAMHAGGLARGRGGPAAWAPEHSSGRPGGSHAPAAAAAGGVSAPSGFSSSEGYSSGSDGSGSGSGSSTRSGSRSSGEAQGMGGAGRARVGGLEVQLASLKLDNMDAMEPARLTLQARSALVPRQEGIASH